jgi:hypothetical protein
VASWCSRSRRTRRPRRSRSLDTAPCNTSSRDTCRSRCQGAPRIGRCSKWLPRGDEIRVEAGQECLPRHCIHLEVSARGYHRGNPTFLESQWSGRQDQVPHTPWSDAANSSHHCCPRGSSRGLAAHRVRLER